MGSYWHFWLYNGGSSRLIHHEEADLACFSCRGQGAAPVILNMRGLCLQSQFDRSQGWKTSLTNFCLRRYVLATSKAELMFYQGDRHTNITYRSSNQKSVFSNK